MFHLWCICQFYGLNSESEVKGSESICMMILSVSDFNVNSSVLFFLFFGMLRVYTFNGDTKVIIYWRKDSSQGLVACKLLLPLRKKNLLRTNEERCGRGHWLGHSWRCAHRRRWSMLIGMALRELHLWGTYGGTGTPPRNGDQPRGTVACKSPELKQGKKRKKSKKQWAE